MKCVICKRGETAPGHTTVTLTRDALALVIRQVPAEICTNCGEAYVDEQVSAALLDQAEQAAAAGIEMALQTFRAPAAAAP
jgi:YgiT-type zinc finger domain-containing protein